MSLFLSCIFYFATKIRKTCYRNKWLNLFKVYLLTEETSCWFPLIESLKIIWKVRNWESLDCFLWHVFPSSIGNNRVIFDLPKVSKMNINFELLEVSKMTNLKIYISPVTKKLETSNLDSRLTSLKGFHWVLLLRW